MLVVRVCKSGFYPHWKVFCSTSLQVAVANERTVLNKGLQLTSCPVVSLPALVLASSIFIYIAGDLWVGELTPNGFSGCSVPALPC